MRFYPYQDSCARAECVECHSFCTHRRSYLQGSLSYFLVQARKIKKTFLKKVLIFSQEKDFLIFQEMERFGHKIKNFLIFFQKNAFLIFVEMELSSHKLKKLLDFFKKYFQEKRPKSQKPKKFFFSKKIMNKFF